MASPQEAADRLLTAASKLDNASTALAASSKSQQRMQMVERLEHHAKEGAVTAPQRRSLAQVPLKTYVGAAQNVASGARAVGESRAGRLAKRAGGFALEHLGEGFDIAEGIHHYRKGNMGGVGTSALSLGGSLLQRSRYEKVRKVGEKLDDIGTSIHIARAAGGDVSSMVSLALNPGKTLRAVKQGVKYSPAAMAVRASFLPAKAARAAGRAVYNQAKRSAREGKAAYGSFEDAIGTNILPSWLTGRPDQHHIPTAGETGVHLSRTVGHLGSMIPGGGLVAKPLAHFGEWISKSAEKAQDFAERLHDANMEFSRFSGAMARVNAEQQARDILLSQKRGENLASSAAYNAEGKSELSGQMARIQDPFTRIRNYLSGAETRFLAKLTIPLAKIGDKVNDILDYLEGSDKDKDRAVTAPEWLADETKTAWVQHYGRPARFNEGEE